MIHFLRFGLPAVFLAIAFWFAYWLISNQPEPRQRNFPERVPEVEVVNLEKVDYPVTLASQGIVQSRTRSNLSAEVRGTIIEIAPNFREGGFFEEGEVLARIDPVDYEADLIIAEGQLAQAELNLAQEEARYEQAKTDWERLGVDEAPSSLVLREPQLRQAQSNLASAKARVMAATRNLERTEIRAPYAGCVLSKNADVGQFVNVGAQLARIYSIDFAEVRLPLSERQQNFLDLQETYRGEEANIADGPRVLLRYTVGSESYNWRGRVVRAEGSIDTSSRQLFVIAQVRNPYGFTEQGRPPLKVGAFVEAEIEGRTIDDVYVIPRRLLNETRFVLVVDEGGLLRRRNLDIVWSSGEEIIVRSGFEEGDRLCLTDVNYALEGLVVNATLLEEDPYAIASNDGEGSDEPDIPRRRPQPQGGGGGGPSGFVQTLLASIPEDKPLPEDLKGRLDAAMASGDRQAIRPIMQEVRAWATQEGIELPAPGGRP